jgi:hypothetical protein
MIARQQGNDRNTLLIIENIIAEKAVKGTNHLLLPPFPALLRFYYSTPNTSISAIASGSVPCASCTRT